MTAGVRFCEEKLLVAGANFLTLRILGRIYSENFCHCWGNVDIVNVLQTFSLEVRAGGVKDGLHLRQPRIMAMLTEKRRRLKEVAYGCPCARVEVQVITGDRNHQDIPGVVAESMKVPFSAAPLLLLIASEIR